MPQHFTPEDPERFTSGNYGQVDNDLSDVARTTNAYAANLMEYQILYAIIPVGVIYQPVEISKFYAIPRLYVEKNCFWSNLWKIEWEPEVAESCLMGQYSGQLPFWKELLEAL